MSRTAALAAILILALVPALGWADCQSAKELYQQAVASKNYADKAKLYGQAVAGCPDFAEAHLNLADALEHLGNYDEAERQYQEAVRLAPQTANAHFGLGDARLKMGLYQRAIEAYQRGLVLDPEDRLAKNNLDLAKALEAQSQVEGVPGTDKIVLMFAETPAIKLMSATGDTVNTVRKNFRAINFELGSTALNPEAKQLLDNFSRALLSDRLRGAQWVIEGHTCDLGGGELNDRLSANRAKSVAEYIRQKLGPDIPELTIKGFGDHRPLRPNDSEDNRKVNRRVEIVKIQPQGS